MPSARTDSKAAVAQQAWTLFFDFLAKTRRYRDEALDRFGLTPNDARALGTIDTVEGKPMSVLARAWSTDASNATWIVNRLEKKGWVKRRSVPHDRRIKQVVLTAAGARIKLELTRRMYAPPPELLELDLADLESLRNALAKLEQRQASPSP